MFINILLGRRESIGRRESGVNEKKHQLIEQLNILNVDEKTCLCLTFVCVYIISAGDFTLYVFIYKYF